MSNSNKQSVIVKESKGLSRIEVPLLEEYDLPMLRQASLYLHIEGTRWEQNFVSPPYDPLFDYPIPLLATFEMTSELLKARFRFVSTKTAHYYMWPRENIVEIRPNRYEPGLWIHVKGQVMETFLGELPDATIAELATTLNAALGRTTPNG